MRQPTVCFRKQTQSYYVAFGKLQVPLGKDESAAWKQYHALMADRQPPSPTMLVATLIDRFLADLKRTAKAPRTHEWYARHLSHEKTGFKKWIEDRHSARLTIDKLTGEHVNAWITERYTNSGDNDKNGAERAISRVCNWAADECNVSIKNPAKKKRHAATPREDAYLEPADWTKVVGAIKPGPFLDIVRFLRLTGCRPYEARIAEKRHFVGQCLIFERVNSKGKKKKRVIQLVGEALAIVQRLTLKHGDGHIFRTSKGNPWSNTSLNTQCDDCETKTGIKVYPYILRHSFITDALVKGMDPMTLAKIVGHTDLKMIQEVYAHLDLKADYLRESLAKIGVA